jgi:hypothetical protein
MSDPTDPKAPALAGPALDRRSLLAGLAVAGAAAGVEASPAAARAAGKAALQSMTPCAPKSIPLS